MLYPARQLTVAAVSVMTTDGGVAIDRRKSTRGAPTPTRPSTERLRRSRTSLPKSRRRSAVGHRRESVHGAPQEPIGERPGGLHDALIAPCADFHGGAMPFL